MDAADRIGRVVERDAAQDLAVATKGHLTEKARSRGRVAQPVESSPQPERLIDEPWIQLRHFVGGEAHLLIDVDQLGRDGVGAVLFDDRVANSLGGRAMTAAGVGHQEQDALRHRFSFLSFSPAG
jgi:hypothetical protein